MIMIKIAFNINIKKMLDIQKKIRIEMDCDESGKQVAN